MAKIGIIGGGIAGLFTAYYLTQVGEQVTLLEKGSCGHGCTWNAAGMLAPINELEFQELALLQAGVASQSLYAGIEAVLGDIGLIRAGTLEVALQGDDEGYLRRLFDFQIEHGLPVEWVPGHQLQSHAPILSRNLACGIWSPADWQVDNRILAGKLVAYLQENGAVIKENCLVKGWSEGKGAIRVETDQGVELFDQLVVSPGLGAFAENQLPYKVYPVRGEMLALQPPPFPFIEKTVRIRSQVLGNAYIVPKAGRILLGSTSEEQGHVPTNTAGGLLDILRKCYAAVPGIYELDVLDTWAGLRPSTLNRLPICDREGDTSIYHLNGLHRHGILLGPLLGQAMATLLLHDRRLPEVESFTL